MAIKNAHGFRVCRRTSTLVKLKVDQLPAYLEDRPRVHCELTAVKSRHLGYRCRGDSGLAPWSGDAYPTPTVAMHAVPPAMMPWSHERHDELSVLS